MQPRHKNAFRTTSYTIGKKQIDEKQYPALSIDHGRAVSPELRRRGSNSV